MNSEAILIDLRLVHPLSNLYLSLDLEVFKGLCSPFPLPQAEMTPTHGAFCLATGEISIDTAFTYSMIAFCVDLEAKAWMCPRITSTDWTLVWSWFIHGQRSYTGSFHRCQRTAQIVIVHDAYLFFVKGSCSLAILPDAMVVTACGGQYSILAASCDDAVYMSSRYERVTKRRPTMDKASGGETKEVVR
jgi:hypothetical protein